MAFTLNEVTILWQLGKDPEIRTTSNNVTVCSFSVATERGWKDKEGNWKNETDWHNITLWNPAEYLRERLKKGAKVLIKGEMRTEKFEKDGVTQYRTKVIAFKVIPVDRKGETHSESSEQHQHEEEHGEMQSGETEDLPF